MKLTVRETQILDLLKRGLTNKEIGLELGISPHTVRDRVSRMLLRHGLKGRTELAAVHTHKTLSRQWGLGEERRVVGERRASRASLLP